MSDPKETNKPSAEAMEAAKQLDWVMYDPRNERDRTAIAALLDAHAAKAVAKEREPLPKESWHEDDGPALWWSFPIQEPPYCGGPLDSDFPDYVTHWTRLLVPVEPTGSKP